MYDPVIAELNNSSISSWDPTMRWNRTLIRRLQDRYTTPAPYKRRRGFLSPTFSLVGCGCLWSAPCLAWWVGAVLLVLCCVVFVTVPMKRTALQLSLLGTIALCMWCGRCMSYQDNIRDAVQDWMYDPVIAELNNSSISSWDPTMRWIPR
jgi:hypothetical protein